MHAIAELFFLKPDSSGFHIHEALSETQKRSPHSRHMHTCMRHTEQKNKTELNHKTAEAFLINHTTASGINWSV